jgi:hypothetical protein
MQPIISAHHRSRIILSLALLGASLMIRLEAAAPQYPQSGINLEFIGQGLVVSPAEVYQYGYFTYVAGVEDLFSGAPENESTAFFTFFNELSTSRVTDNGPVRIVDRQGTATIYLNPAGGASYTDLDSFQVGTAVLTADLRHQAILDTANGNTLVVHFDLTIVSAAPFTTAAREQRLGKPGQKLSWTAFGRPNPAPNPGQFVYAGMGLIHPPAAPGLSIGRVTAANEIQLEVDSASGTRSRLESSPDLTNWTLMADLDHAQAKVTVSAPAVEPTRFYRATTE